MTFFNFKQRKKIIGNDNKITCKQFNLEIHGNHNSINVDSNIFVKKISHTSLKITGNNNTIKINKGFKANKNFSLFIVGDNNSVELEENIVIIDNLCIQILEKCQNARIHIGSNTTFWNTKIQTCDLNSSIKIGQDCMFSYNTSVLNSDGHAIFQNNILINQGKNLVIGDHSWIGYNSTIYKNTILPNNIIIARDALVTSAFKEKQENVIIGGIPAKIIKNNITWSRETPNEILKKDMGE